MKKHNPRFIEIVNKAKAEINEIEVQNIPNKALIIDVREESEFDQSHAKGSIHIGKGILERDIEKHNNTYIRHRASSATAFLGLGIRQ